jgi:hypothetical protein
VTDPATDGPTGDSAYASYGYLPASEVAQFDLDPEFDRVPAYDLGLDQVQADRSSAA